MEWINDIVINGIIGAVCLSFIYEAIRDFVSYISTEGN